MNSIDAAAARLVAALSPILPNGRVTPTKRPVDIGPAIWLEPPTITPNQVQSPTLFYADFPTWVTYDGSDDAQVAGINQIVARIIDAVQGVKQCWILSARPGDERRENGAWRTHLVVIRMVLLARGFCAPDPPTEAPIPPQPTNL